MKEYIYFAYLGKSKLFVSPVHLKPIRSTYLEDEETGILYPMEILKVIELDETCLEKIIKSYFSPEKIKEIGINEESEIIISSIPFKQLPSNYQTLFSISKN